jgi:hypothetical protein
MSAAASIVLTSENVGSQSSGSSRSSSGYRASYRKPVRPPIPLVFHWVCSVQKILNAGQFSGQTSTAAASLAATANMLKPTIAMGGAVDAAFA